MVVQKGGFLSTDSYFDLANDLVLLDLCGLTYCIFLAWFSLLDCLEKATSILLFNFERLLDDILEREGSLYIVTAE